MRRLAILHFNAIELYPPVLNWLNFLAENGGREIEVRVITMSNVSAVNFTPRADNIKIIRSGVMGKKGIRAWLNYLSYYARALLYLVKWRPDTVLYYETLSALPAVIYKKYLRPDSNLFIHYHEYVTPVEYEEGMRLGRWIHGLEKKLYKKAKWISQTNEDRVALFRSDINSDHPLPLFTLPNYPPCSWLSSSRQKTALNDPIRIVYVGALSLETMYTREMAEWVISQSGKVLWDIYSDNITPDAQAFLQSFHGQLIRFNKGVNYFSLPEVLGQYDIGIILYKGHIPNYIYNAPNKLFEYMACGLDVWFPDVMKGCLGYFSPGSSPKIIALDFGQLGGLDLEAVLDRDGLQQASSVYCAENVLPSLLNYMKQ